MAGVVLSGDDKDSSATLKGPWPYPPWRSEAGEEVTHRWQLGLDTHSQTSKLAWSHLGT